MEPQKVWPIRPGTTSPEVILSYLTENMLRIDNVFLPIPSWLQNIFSRIF